MPPAPTTLPPGALDRVGDHIAHHAGLKLPDWVLESRLSERIAALGLANASAYVELITTPRGARELDLLIEVLRVGETGFFRQRSHIKALTDVVVPALAGREQARVRAWSAGCATGEEAYTLAMILAKLLPRATVEVTATDLSSEALAVARAGLYPDAALAPVPPVWRNWAFTPTHGDKRGWRIADHVAARVRFERHNLADDVFPGNYDLIWCRNVLIYFAPESRRQTVNRLVDSLARDGFLFVGYAESLRDFATVDPVRTPDAVLYRKASPAPAPVATPTRASPSAAATSLPPPNPHITAEELFIQLRGRYADGTRLAAELAATMAGPHSRVVVDLDGADYLGDDAAAVMRRARSAAVAAGIEFTLIAERPGPLRWLRRSGLGSEGQP